MNSYDIRLENGIAGIGQFIAGHLNDVDKWKRSESAMVSCLKDPLPAGTIVDLPSTTVRVRNAHYHIHGIVHGGWLLNRPAERVRRFVQDRAREYAGPIGLSLLCEERFSRYWGLHQAADIDDIGRTPSASDQVEQLVDEWRTYRGGIASASHESRHGISRMVSAAAKHALRDERHMSTVRTMYNELPYPLILEDEVAGLAHFYTDLLRSKYIAEYVLSYTALSGISNLHILMGLGHEREVRYFVTHPEASLQECIASLAAHGNLQSDHEQRGDPS